MLSFVTQESMTEVMPEKRHTNAQAVRIESVPEETLFTIASGRVGYLLLFFTDVCFSHGRNRQIIPQIKEEMQIDANIILPELLEESIMLPSAFTVKPIPGFMQKSMSFSA